jgi:hypothetical protein
MEGSLAVGLVSLAGLAKEDVALRLDAAPIALDSELECCKTLDTELLVTLVVEMAALSFVVDDRLLKNPLPFGGAPYPASRCGGVATEWRLGTVGGAGYPPSACGGNVTDGSAAFGCAP